MNNEVEEQGRLILAAEDCEPNVFKKIHKFSKYEDKIIRSLIAHGPVLIRGGRGSGKSALLIEAHNRVQESYNTIFNVYLSLRHLPLLRSQGEEYEKIFCRLLVTSINNELQRRGLQELDIAVNFDVGDLQQALVKLSSTLSNRIVLFFDDAAHIGRETALEEFFNIFRTISSSTVSCKAAIYPGVTNFGIRFDVYNDATVIDISRDERRDDFTDFFAEVINARYPRLLQNTSESLKRNNTLAWFLGRSVVGNMRALIFACNRLSEEDKKIDLQELRNCLIYLSSDYYWSLLDEVAPKLGKYEPLVEPCRELAENLFDYVTADKKTQTPAEITTSVLIHRDLVQKYSKLFEILEYAGFITRREVSRAMKSGGRGSRFILNLCNLLEKTSGVRLTIELLDTWRKNDETSEIYKNSSILTINLPELSSEEELSILQKDICHIKKSKSYPYGLTDAKFQILKDAKINTIGELAETPDAKLKELESIGVGTINRIHNVVGQAIWM
ncbi:MAG: hypothetical protein PHO08_02970 [Methylococcales bacterium]|nr:hypothetical protein [Methylococcales bacterium]MDD5632927.1 hypothetical protein [Methylococcales bacterium]